MKKVFQFNFQLKELRMYGLNKSWLDLEFINENKGHLCSLYF